MRAGKESRVLTKSTYFSLPPIVHMDSTGLHWTLPKITVFGKDYLWYAFRVRGLGLGIQG